MKKLIINTICFLLLTQSSFADEIIKGNSYIVYGKLAFAPKISLIELSSELYLDQNTYNFKFNIKTINLANIIKKINGVGFVQGIITKGEFYPKNYSYNYQKNDKEKTVELEFLEKKVVSEKVHPEFDKRELSIVTGDMLIDVIDPASMFLTISNYRLSKECSGSIKVYDGKRRYDLNYISKNIFDNKIECLINQVKLGGYKNKDMDPLAQPEQFVVSFTKDAENYKFLSLIGKNNIVEISILPK